MSAVPLGEVAVDVLAALLERDEVDLAHVAQLVLVDEVDEEPAP